MRAGVAVAGVDHASSTSPTPDAVRAQLATRRRRGVLNAAAFTQVDRCEREPDAAGARQRARAPARAGARLPRRRHRARPRLDRLRVRRRRDSGPIARTTRPAPRSVYGRTKLAGERAVLAASPRLPGRAHELGLRPRPQLPRRDPRSGRAAPRAARRRARCASSTTSAGARPTRSTSPPASGGWSKSARAASTMSRTRAWPPGGTWRASASTRRGAATSR